MQIALRVANETYLREHPELSRMLAEFVAVVVKSKPDNVLECAREFFTSDAAAAAVASDSLS